MNYRMNGMKHGTTLGVFATQRQAAGWAAENGVKSYTLAPTQERLSYNGQCAAAASAQGLDPITASLRKVGVKHRVEQTGGFTMVVVVDHGDAGVWAVINDGAFYAVWLPEKAWDQGGEEGESVESADLSEVIEAVRTPWGA